MAVSIGFDDDDDLALLVGCGGLDCVVVVADGGEVDSVDGSVLVWLDVWWLLMRLLYLMQRFLCSCCHRR